MSGDFMKGDYDTGTVVPFTDDEEEVKAKENLFEDEPEELAKTPEGKSRKQKRNERLQTMLRSGEEAQKKATELEERLARQDAELQRLQQYVQQATRPQQQPGVDPYTAELDKIDRERDLHFQRAQAELKAGSLTADKQKDYEKIARELDERRADVFAERAIARREPGRIQQQQQQIWVQKYPEVYANPRAFQYAQAKFQEKIALGETATNALTDAILTEAQTVFKLGPRSAPSATDKDRLSGIASTGANGSGGRSNAFPMTREMTKMAIAAYPDMPEDKAIKKWVQTTGKKLRDQKVI